MAYTEPTPADLKARYPAFAGVGDPTLQLYLDDAADMVSPSWLERDYIPAKCALAAHRMALLGIGATSQIDQFALSGVERVKSGALDVSLSAAKVAQSATGGLRSTPYGRAFRIMLLRNAGGPRVVGAGLNMRVSEPTRWDS